MCVIYVDVGRGPNNFRGHWVSASWDSGTQLAPWKHDRPPRVNAPNLFVVYEPNYADPPERIKQSRPAFQGHSRSSEPTQIDRLRLPITDQ